MSLTNDYRTISYQYLPYLACILITNNAVYPAMMAMKIPIRIAATSPDCLIAHGTDNKEVPIIVFQIAKLKMT